MFTNLKISYPTPDLPLRLLVTESQQRLRRPRLVLVHVLIQRQLVPQPSKVLHDRITARERHRSERHRFSRRLGALGVVVVVVVVVIARSLFRAHRFFRERRRRRRVVVVARGRLLDGRRRGRRRRGREFGRRVVRARHREDGDAREGM